MFWSQTCGLFKNECDYEILPFKFLVCEMNLINSPCEFIVSKEDLKKGELGGFNKKTGEYIKGFKQLIEELEWAKKQNKWDYPKEYYKNNAFTLNIFGE